MLNLRSVSLSFQFLRPFFKTLVQVSLLQGGRCHIRAASVHARRSNPETPEHTRSAGTGSRDGVYPALSSGREDLPRVWDSAKRMRGDTFLLTSDAQVHGRTGPRPHPGRGGGLENRGCREQGSAPSPKAFPSRPPVLEQGKQGLCRLWRRGPRFSGIGGQSRPNATCAPPVSL